jgi:hypothetical protein
MDEAVIIKELGDVIANLRKIRKETWGQSNLCTLPIDEEIKSLEELISDLDTNWNGSHPVGQS